MTAHDTNATDAARLGPGCEQLEVGYPLAPKPVIEGLELQVPAGHITCLIGPNGSGKSTLLKALSRQIKLSGGRVFLEGTDVAAATPREFARRLAILFQENVAPAGLTVEGLVRHGRFPHLGFFQPHSTSDDRAIERALGLTGTQDLKHRRVDQLSGGQRQLVWIAMALAQETQTLLLDEPTTFLDLGHQLQVMRVVQKLQREHGITIVMVMHDVNLAARYAHHMFLFRDGAVIAAGSPDDVVTPENLRIAYDIEGRVLRDPVSGSLLFLADAPIAH